MYLQKLGSLNSRNSKNQNSVLGIKSMTPIFEDSSISSSRLTLANISYAPDTVRYI